MPHAVTSQKNARIPDMSDNWAGILFGVIAGLGVITSGYLAYQYHLHTERIEMLYNERQYFSQQFASTSEQLVLARNTVSELEAEQERLREELEDLADDYRDERDKNEEFEDQIRDLAGTLGDLNKLQEIDEELLQKYSRVSFLNENYIPRKLTQIDERYVHPNADDEYFLADAYQHLRNLMRAADRADLNLSILSAYRSFDRQNELKQQYLVTYGEGANQFSADQGFSEHQLGTAVDFTTDGSMEVSFAETEEYEWLLKNAHRYGFILSYPEGNEFYVFEPWHWRFVGRDLASDLNRSDETFYTKDQREIDAYLLEIFD
jgi:D-alanyl-D-alanine carboxypeptidase